MHITLISLSIVIFTLCTGASVHAIQSHGAPEGMYVHQVGHLLYALAMVGFAFSIRKSRLTGIKGWKLISIGAILLACWNIWAFCAHIIDTAVPGSHFIVNSSGIKTAIIADSRLDYFYYIFKMDHLICVPALLVMYIGLKKIGSTSRLFSDPEDRP